uniref:SANT domain-containing protein n=1 Tax=Gongylonema pulchrum TaxID=637853 RepID=A0A183EKG6_9BILA
LDLYGSFYQRWADNNNYEQLPDSCRLGPASGNASGSPTSSFEIPPFVESTDDEASDDELDSTQSDFVTPDTGPAQQNSRDVASDVGEQNSADNLRRTCTRPSNMGKHEPTAKQDAPVCSESEGITGSGSEHLASSMGRGIHPNNANAAGHSSVHTKRTDMYEQFCGSRNEAHSNEQQKQAFPGLKKE